MAQEPSVVPKLALDLFVLDRNLEASHGFPAQGKSLGRGLEEYGRDLMVPSF
jgi:hypothetical protein